MNPRGSTPVTEPRIGCPTPSLRSTVGSTLVVEEDAPRRNREADNLDEVCFADLYPDLRRLAAVVADTDIDPDDLVQEALVRVLQRGPLSNLRNPGAYLRRAIVNTASNERRRRGRWRRVLARLPTEIDDTAMEAHYPSNLADLTQLAPQDRAVLYLTEVAGFSAAEVAGQLGLTVNAVNLRASRARRRLRAHLREEQDVTAKPQGRLTGDR